MVQPSLALCVSSISYVSRTWDNPRGLCVSHPYLYTVVTISTQHHMLPACLKRLLYVKSTGWSFSRKKTGVQRTQRSVLLQPVTRLWVCGMLPSLLHTSSKLDTQPPLWSWKFFISGKAYEILEFSCCLLNDSRNSRQTSIRYLCLSLNQKDALQAGRPQVLFLMVSLEFFIEIILLAALWPWSWLSL